MTSRNFSVDEFRSLVISVNNEIIDKFDAISERIDVALEEDSSLQSDTRELLEQLDGRIENLIKKVKEINSSIPR